VQQKKTPNEALQDIQNKALIMSSPHGVVGPLPDPVRHGAILLQLLAQLALDDKRLV
jgi:hypothetical protein